MTNSVIDKIIPEPSVYKVEHFQGDIGYWSSSHPVWQNGLYLKDKDRFTCTALYTREEVEAILKAAVLNK